MGMHTYAENGDKKEEKKVLAELNKNLVSVIWLLLLVIEMY